MPFPHQQHAQAICNQLVVLADQLKTRTRASQNDANHWLESVMKRFLNALMGWELVNLNAEQSNYPAADLGDVSRRIAVQVTNQDAGSKITETAKKAVDHRLVEKFDRIIIFFLLPAKPSTPKSFEQPANGPVIECWDLADLLKRMAELPDQSRIADAAAVLARELSHEFTGMAPPPSNLPGGYIGQPFVGREEFLKDLRASLLKQTHATAITQSMGRKQQPAATVAEGLGGLGKTHAAVEYAYRHRDEYSALLFVSGDSPQKLQSSLAALCEVKGLGLDEHLPNEEEARAKIALHWLATHERWLLIVDNVDDEEGATALTAHFDQLHRGHVLITSRLHQWSRQVDSLDLSVLSTEDGADLLLQLTEKDRRTAADDETQARLLAEQMEGLPLALHQAAGYINENACTLAQYLTTYQKEAAELLGWFNDLSIPYERPDKKVPRPVLITWKTSFDQLTPEARQWLLVFSHYAPEPIPEFLVEAAEDAKEEVKTLLRVARQALAQMTKLGLITRFKDDPPRFKIHRLVQEVTRVTAKNEDIAIALDFGILLIAMTNPGIPQDVLNWGKWSPLQPHVIALCQHAPDKPPREGVAWLLSSLSLLLKAKALYAEALPYIRRALKIAEDCFGDDDSKVTGFINNLAALLYEMNRLDEAEALMRRVLQIDQVCFGPNHPLLAGDLANLAQLLQVSSRLDEAELLMRQSLQIAEENIDSAGCNIVVQLNNLAQLLVLTNRKEEAKLLILKALDAALQNNEVDHPNVATILSNLAQMIRSSGGLAEAESIMRRVLQIDRMHYAHNHTAIARDLNNIASILHESNRLDEAEILMKEASKINEICFGSNHYIVATDLNNLAQIFQSTGRIEEAEIMMRRALEIDKNSFGLNNAAVARDLHNLAQLLHSRGQVEEAWDLMMLSLNTNEIVYGSVHSSVAHDLSGLAQILISMNRLVDAELLMRQALQIDENSFGMDHPDVATDLNNLASLLQVTDRAADAELMLCRAVGIFVKRLGAGHPKSQTACGNYISVLKALDLPDAEIQKRVREAVGGGVGEG